MILYRGLIFLLCCLSFFAHSRDVGGPPEEQEPGDVSDSEEGSGRSDQQEAKPVEYSLADKMRWVTYSKEHGAVVRDATEHDAENVVIRQGLRNSKKHSIDCASGQELKSPIGIVYELEDEEEEEETTNRSDSHPQPLPSSSFHHMDTSSYPGFATGLLKSKNCTAFLIGKFSALTLAECVYDRATDHWTQDLDLWRGRNCKTYIELMEWESVTIPRLYYTTGDDSHNWAYIKYQASMPSDNWIGLSYDCQLTHKPDVSVTLAGYQKGTSEVGCPYKCSCSLLGKKHQTFCKSKLPFSFPGSPLVAAPSIPLSGVPSYIGTSPRLYGIASGPVDLSMNKVTMITEEMFWLVYDLMEYNGDKPQCDSSRQEWFINRIFKT